ncbi:hypothetical protein GGU11DRAFT_750571 [Lentinula aff. detonsa]|nr:hypothetical protein GGU11DRAFT_750571 [Lentinula aff. detonsa]
MEPKLPSSDSIPEGQTTHKTLGTTLKPQNNGVKLTLKIEPSKKSTDSTTTVTTGKATISTSTLEVDTKEPGYMSTVMTMPSSTPAVPTIIPWYLTSSFSSVTELTSMILLHFAFISLTP